jgi:hypothetical protein
MDDASSYISTTAEPLFEYIDGVKSPFILPLIETYTPFVSTIIVPQMLFTADGDDRTLKFTGELLTLTYQGNQPFVSPAQSVMTFEGDDATVFYDSAYRVMVYYHYLNTTNPNATKEIQFGLVDNNGAYPINLEIELREEIVESNTAIIPEHLLAIIYDPPGDHSFGQLKEGTSITYGITLTDESSTEEQANYNVRVFGLGGGEDVQTTSTTSTTYDQEVTISYQKTLTSSQESDDPALIGPGKGDLYYGTSIIMEYFIIMNNYYIINGTADLPGQWVDDIQVWTEGDRIDYSLEFDTTFSVLGAYLDEYNMTQLENYNIFADNELSELELPMVKKQPDSPLFWTPDSVTEMTSSYVSEGIISHSATIIMEEDSSFNFDHLLQGGAQGFSMNIFQASGKIGVSTKLTFECTRSSSTSENREILAHLEDDDGTPIGQHDQFMVDVYVDRRFQTFGYIIHEDFTYTSNPYEYGTRDRRPPSTAEIIGMPEYVHGTLLINCAAVDDETGIHHVKYYYDDDPVFGIDSILLGSQEIPLVTNPEIYQFAWNTKTGDLFGNYYLFTVTYDNATQLWNKVISPACPIFIDNINPTTCRVQIYEPYTGAISIYATAADVGSGIAYIEYWEGPPSGSNSSYLGMSDDTGNSYRFIWATDSNGTDDGPHIIYARAYDRAGNYLDSAGFSFEISSDFGYDDDSSNGFDYSFLAGGGIITVGLLGLGFLLKRPQKYKK